MENKLIAFHGDAEIKEKYVRRVKAHAEADRITKGQYWEHGKGCAVGCTSERGLSDSPHQFYPEVLGIPIEIAYLEDRIFEGLPNAEAMKFPLQFLEAIPVGADLSGVIPKFLPWLLVDPDCGVINYADEQGKSSVQQVADLYSRRIAGDEPSEAEWEAAAYAAYAADAAYAATRASDAAIRAAYAAYAADAAIRAAQRDKLLSLLAEAPIGEVVR